MNKILKVHERNMSCVREYETTVLILRLYKATLKIELGKKNVLTIVNKGYWNCK